MKFFFFVCGPGARRRPACSARTGRAIEQDLCCMGPASLATVWVGSVCAVRARAESPPTPPMHKLAARAWYTFERPERMRHEAPAWRGRPALSERRRTVCGRARDSKNVACPAHATQLQPVARTRTRACRLLALLCQASLAHVGTQTFNDARRPPLQESDRAPQSQPCAQTSAASRMILRGTLRRSCL